MQLGLEKVIINIKLYYYYYYYNNKKFIINNYFIKFLYYK